jgi:peptidoglycan/xylan/chitin deacetylase (PgdA/CDA1 family)
VLALCHHAVSADWDAPLSVTPERFEQQLRYVIDRGYRGVTFSEAALGGAEEKVVAVTFDDGYRSVLELAAPIMERLGIPGTLFVPTDHVGRDEPMSWPGIDRWLGGPHEHELLPLSWEQLRRLAEAGWEIGSHTRSHPHLIKVSDKQLDEELGGSRQECERMLDEPCLSLAYPYGDHDARVIAAAAAAGYSTAATLPADNPRPSPLSFPRIGVYHVDDERSFRLKVSPTIRWLRRSRAWGPLMQMARGITAKRSGGDDQAEF